MKYTLSLQAVVDAVRAFAALQQLSIPRESRIADPLLDPHRSGILAEMARNEFAGLVLALAPFVEDAEIDVEGPDGSALAHAPADLRADGSPDAPPMHISLTLRDTATAASTGILASVRRAMEQYIAWRIIAARALTIPQAYPDSTIGEAARRAEAAIALICDNQHSPIRPCVTRPWTPTTL